MKIQNVKDKRKAQNLRNTAERAGFQACIWQAMDTTWTVYIYDLSSEPIPYVLSVEYELAQKSCEELGYL